MKFIQNLLEFGNRLLSEQTVYYKKNNLCVKAKLVK